MKYYEVTAKVTKIDNRGEMKSITEKLLVKANLFTDAEKKGYERLLEDGAIDPDITAIRITQNKVDDFLDGETIGFDFFGVKISIEAIDPNSEKEKRRTEYIIVECSDMDYAKNEILNSERMFALDAEIKEIKNLGYSSYVK